MTTQNIIATMDEIARSVQKHSVLISCSIVASSTQTCGRGERFASGCGSMEKSRQEAEPNVLAAAVTELWSSPATESWPPPSEVFLPSEKSKPSP
eukprot:2610002-Amphidinium_carterae.1